MHHLSSIAGVAVLVMLEDGQGGTRAAETLDASHDVYHGLGIETRYRRAPDVFNRVGNQPCANRINKKLALSLESARPILIVQSDMYWRVVGHGVRIGCRNEPRHSIVGRGERLERSERL